MKTHPLSLYTVDSVIWEEKENKGNQQIDFSLHCCLLLFQKPAQPDKHFDEVMPTSFAKLFDKPYWLMGVCGNAHQQEHPYPLSDGDVTFSLSSDSCKAQDIYRKGYLFISTTKALFKQSTANFQDFCLPFSSCKRGLGNVSQSL